MPVIQGILGRKITTTPAPDFGAIAAGQLRACVFENPTLNHCGSSAWGRGPETPALTGRPASLPMTRRVGSTIALAIHGPAE